MIMMWALPKRADHDLQVMIGAKWGV